RFGRPAMPAVWEHACQAMPNIFLDQPAPVLPTNIHVSNVSRGQSRGSRVLVLFLYDRTHVAAKSARRIAFVLSYRPRYHISRRNGVRWILFVIPGIHSPFESIWDITRAVLRGRFISVL